MHALDLVGPLQWPKPYTHAHAHMPAGPRRTLSFAIASQTIASSPDGSEISSAAKSACGTPAATVGGGCRFRASSPVTSSCSPYNNTHGHIERKARSADGGRALRTTCCPVCTPIPAYLLGWAVSTEEIPEFTPA